MSRFISALLAVVSLSLSGIEVRSQDANSEANKLFVEAVTLYRAAQASGETEKSEAYAEVRALFDRILRDHPDSRPAGVIGQGGNPGGVVLSDLPASVPIGWNDGKRTIVRALLEAYGGDRERLSAVASAHDWAVLACAAYSEDGALCRDKITGEADVLVSEIGWTPGKPIIGDYLGVGQAVAYFYTHEDGRVALVFRGSDEGRDFVTNILGSADPSFLNAAQLRFAVKLAEDAVASHPNTVFVGHSLGGRLAQIGALSTGRPAIAFNSAPLGSWETIRYAHTLARREELVTRLRGPDDPVSVLAGQSASEQIEVSNMARTGEGFLGNVANARSYTHSMAPLAGAVRRVHEAESLGWVAAYLAEQAGADETGRGADGDWGPEILEGVADIRQEYRPCSGVSDPAACFRSKGASDSAIAFILAIQDEPSSFTSFPLEFRETGPIDVAHVEWQGASTNTWPVLLNGTPKEVPIRGTADLAATFIDPTSRKMLAKYPKATVYSGAIRAHRLLGDGTQRFVHVELITDGCRACTVPGSAVTFLDIGPSTGGALRTIPVGLFLDERFAQLDVSRGMPLQRFPSAEELRSNPASLQTALNFLGYDAGEMDGYPGPQTRNAFMAFQAEHCLPATGQPDSASTNALLSSDGFKAPCAGQAVPAGIHANAPLVSGKYVRDPAQCAMKETPWDLLWEQILVDGTSFMLGHENPCTTRRTDIRDGVTLFRGSCSWADTTREASWRLDLRSNSEFAFLGQENTFGDLEPATYKRCETRETETGEARPASVPAEDKARGGISFVFPREELDRVAALSNDGELSSTGFNVDISERLSVACTHWVPLGTSAPSEYGIATWEALLPRLQCNLWSETDDGSAVRAPEAEVSASFDADSGAMVLVLKDAAVFQSARRGSQAPCVYSVRNKAHQYRKEWQVACQADVAANGVAQLAAQSAQAPAPSCKAGWVTTSDGCRACVERPEGWLSYMQKTANPSTRWSGACRDGLIDGQGVLTWYSGEDEGWRTILNARYPAVAGVPAFDLRPGDVTVRYADNLSDGTVGYDRRCVAVTDAVHDVSPLLVIVNETIPLANPEVHRVVMEEAERIALADCEQERKRVGGRKEVARFQVYSINLALSNHPRVKPFLESGRPIPGGDLYRILPGCGFRPRLSGLSECFQENPATDEIRQQVSAANQARADAIRQAERRRVEQAAQAEKARKQARVAAIQKQVEQQWASHMDDMFSGQQVIQNVGDLLQFNKARAISLLSQGVTLQLATENMSFQDGTVLISHEHDPTDVLKPVRDAARAEMGSWEQWFDTTANVGRDYSGPSITVVCRLDASALEQLDGKSSAIFSATMKTLNGRSAIFDCDLKR